MEPTVVDTGSVTVPSVRLVEPLVADEVVAAPWVVGALPAAVREELDASGVGTTASVKLLTDCVDGARAAAVGAGV
jgi:hypothetical protein